MGRRADLKTGYDCNSNCVFCVIGDKLFSGDRSTRDCIEELRLSRRTCTDVVFTGAEVTIRPDFFALVQAAKRLGYDNIQIQTNGRMMAYREFCERAIAAGANEFSPSIHAPNARIHDALTRSRGSFEQIVRAIEHLVALDQRVVTNTVITRRNAELLPELARMLVDLGVQQFQLAFPHPTGHAWTHFEAVVPRMAEVVQHVHVALDIGLSAGVQCMAEAIPFCFMEGHEPQVAELHIPPTEIVYDGYVVQDYEADRVGRGKTRFEQCAACRFEPICEGPWREYPERMGSEEFVPVDGVRVIERRLVLEGLLDRVGAPSPSVPEVPKAAWVAVVFYPQDGSPACTAQLCGVQSRREELAARGIEVIGVSPDDEARHREFARRQGLQFPLVADVDGAIARQWRAGGRWTYLVDDTGRIRHILVDVDVDAHAEQILAAVDRLEAPARPLQPRTDLVTLRRRPPAEAG
jgi:peroxiredoxin/MoaA/NifB/PqqE/SkfB family radical SAM enzyme